MMNYSELVKTNRIKGGRFSDKQIQDCLDLAERDLETAQKIGNDNPDWAFAIAYNAMLQTVRALMFSEGYRAIGEGQHATAIQFAQYALGVKFLPSLEFMDRMRRKRNRTVYDMAGLISKKEADEAIETATLFARKIAGFLKK